MKRIRSDVGQWNAFVDKIGSNFGFRFANIRVTEKELAIQIRNVNGIHIDYVELAEAH